MFAMGVPMERAEQMPLSYTANTTYIGNGAYTTIQPQQNPGQGMADLGAAIGNIARKQQAMRVCMMSKGYTLHR